MKSVDTTRKLSNLALALLFFLGVFAGISIPAAEAQATTSLVIADSRLIALPDGVPVFGQGAAVYLVLTSPASDTTPSIDAVKAVISASSFGGAAASCSGTPLDGGATWTVDLLETGARTGVFAGSFHVQSGSSGKAAPTKTHPIYGKIFGDGLLQVSTADLGLVCVSGTVAGTSVSDSVVWRRSADATFIVQKDGDAIISTSAGYAGIATGSLIQGYGRRLTFRVIDADMHANNGATSAPEQYPELLKVFSDSDREGEFVPLVESKENNNVDHAAISSNQGTFFFGSIGFEPTKIPNDGKVAVQHGDRVWAEFIEAADVAGQPRTSHLPPRAGQLDTWSFVSSSDGFVQWTGTPIIVANAIGDDFVAAGTVQVVDLDRSLGSTAADSVTVFLSSTSAPNQVTMTATERGGLTGEFFGDVTFRKNCSPADNSVAQTPTSLAVLCIASGDTIYATYTDNPDFSGVLRTRTDSTRFIEATTGVLTIGPSASTSRLVGTDSLFNVDLDNEKDANQNPAAQDTVQVLIKSASDATGIVVNLLETSQNSNHFVGAFGFTNGASNGNRIKVADRDSVVATYADALRADGRPGRTTSNLVVWRAPTAAQVSLDSDVYVQSLPGPGALGPVAHIVIDDQDQNNPFQRDSVLVNLVVPGAPQGITATAQEVGLDTGLFLADVQFASASDDSATPPRFSPGVGASRSVRAEYSDQFSPAGPNQVVSSTTATWLDATASLVRFEQSASVVERVTNVFHPAPKTGLPGTWSTVTVVAYGASNPSPILVTSTRCPAGLNVVLAASPGSANRFVGTLTLDSAAGTGSTETARCANLAGASRLGVAVGNTLSIAGSLAADRATVLPFAMSVAGMDRTGTVVDPTIFGYQAPGYIWIKGGAGNEHRGGRDIISVDVTPYALSGVNRGPDPDTAKVLHVQAVETGADTGTFVTSVGTRALGTSMAEYRVEATSPPNVFAAASEAGTKQYDKVLEPRFLYAETMVNSTTFRGGLTWYPASDANLATVAGFGSAALPTVLLNDDAFQGTSVQQFIPSSASNVFTLQAATLSPKFTAVYGSVAAEAVASSGISAIGTVTLKSAADGGDSMEPVADANNDGAIDCRDVTPSRSSIVCTSTPQEIMSGTYKFADPCTLASGPGGLPVGGGGNCDFTVAYRYRAVPSTRVGVVETPTDNTQDDDVFHFKVVGTNQIQFGANIPAGALVSVQFRQATIPIQARSINGGETETLPLTLQTTGVNIDKYAASLPLQFSQTTGDGLLYVRPSTTDHQDRIQLVFNDARLADGQPGSGAETHFRSVLASADWFQTEAASLSFRKTDLSGPAPSTFFGPYVPIQITDIDADVSSRPDTMTAQARNSNAATDTVTVTLRETGPRTGVFVGLVPVAAGTPTAGDDVINLQQGTGQEQSFTVTRADPHNAAGAAVSPQVSQVWRPSTDGVVRVFTSASDLSCTTGGTDPLALAGAASALYVAILDADANANRLVRDHVQVLVSTASLATGKVVDLLETGADTGCFHSAATLFGPQAGADRVLALDLARQGEEVRVSYADPLNQQGVAQRFEPSGSITWSRRFDGFTFFDRPVFVGVTPASANDATQAGLIPTGVVLVADGDLNADPRNVDEPTVTVSVLRVDPVSGTEISGSSTQLRMFETSANSGVFLGRFAFAKQNNGDGACADDLTTCVVGVTASPPESLLIRARYVDATDSQGGGQSFIAESRWTRAGVGVVQLDRDSYTDLNNVVGVTLYDGQLDTTAGADQVTVQARSTVNTATLNVVLTEILTETGTSTGIFTGSFGLTSGATGSGRLQVSNTDAIQVVYNDASPAGARTGAAAIRIGDRTPPITTIATTTVPTGLRGVFLAKTNVTFTANEPVKRTFYTLNGSDPRLWDGLSIPLNHGVYNFRAWSVDQADNDESSIASAVPSRTIVVDLTPVTASVSAVVGKAIAGGKVQLNWTDAANRNDPTEFYEFLVYRDGAAAPIGNSTVAGFVDGSLADELAHSYQVAISDKGGHIGPKSSAVSVTPDRVVPVLSASFVTPTGFDVRAKPAGGMSVRVDATDKNLDRVVARLETPAGAALTNVTMVPTSGNTFAGTLSLTGITQPCTCTLVISAFDKAGNEGKLTFTIRITGPDTQLPVVSFGLNGTQLPSGTGLQVTVTDNVAVSSVQYSVDGGSPIAVPVGSAQPVVQFTVPANLLLPGSHTVVVTVEDNATDENGGAQHNRATGTLSFTVVEGSGPGPGSQFLPTTVSARSDGSIVVSWGLPANAISATGFQVWRAASPFALVGTINDPSQRQFIDASAEAGKTYRYVVTFFTTSPFTSLAQVPGYPGSDEQVAGSQPVQTAGTGTPQWIWIVVGALAVIAVAALIAIAVASRRGGTQQQVLAPEAAAPPAQPEPEPSATMPVSADVHRIRCPQCSHRFEVAGTKPIVTNCPNCGRKGILR